MAYKLLDQNGNYMEINGMHKGTILSPYEYHGMELYNENAISNAYPFYSLLWGGRRRVRVGNNYYVPSGTDKKYVDEAYGATEIAINGSYSNSSFKDYEVYKDGNLVASGSFTSSDTDIYVCEKEANTSIIVRGIWDEANSKFIYNITTNATIERNHSYKWDNGILTTSSIELPIIYNKDAVTDQNIPESITMPTRADIEAMLPSDCSIIDISSVSYLLTFSKYPNSNPEYLYDMWLRTSHSTTTMNPSSLPGSSVCSVSRVGYDSSKTYTLSGTSRLGATYYLYSRHTNTSGSYAGSNYYAHVQCVATATVKYRYFDGEHTVKVNVTRTNEYTLPACSINQVKEFLPSFGTSTISSFRYHLTFKNNASSGSYTYYKIMEGSNAKQSGSISLGTTRKGSIKYTSNMSSTLVLKMSNASDGNYINGMDSYISFSNEEGAHYLEIFYTWTPPEQ